METLWQDLKYATRMLARNPGFTAVAVLTLALGIGANTAVFSLVSALLLNPLPGVAKPAQLVMVGRSQDGRNLNSSSYPNYADYRARNTVFSALAAHFGFHLGISNGERTERVWAEAVSGNYFSLLGVPPELGRPLAPEDDQSPGGQLAVVISHGLWKRVFGSDPDVVGKVVRLNGRSFTLVGVMSEGFRGASNNGVATDVWVPIVMIGSDGSPRDSVWLHMIGRLKPGISLAQARAEMISLTKQLEQEYPQENKGLGIALIPGAGLRPRIRTSARQMLRLLTGVVSVVLLIACANIANLLLARGTQRRREIAVRTAVGASRVRLARQLLTEGVLLWLLGGTVGLFLAVWTADALWALAPPAFSRMAIEPSPNARVFGFGLLLSLVTGIAFALVPALQTAKLDLVTALKESRRTQGSHRSYLRSSFVISQVSLSLVLLVGAGLFARTLWNLGTIGPGFEAKQVLTFSMDPDQNGYTRVAGQRFYERLLQRVQALAGVRSATLAFTVPLSGNNYQDKMIIEGREKSPEDPWLLIPTNVVGPRYFETMGIPLVQGREFTPQDRAGAQKVAVVNEAFARRYFPGENPVGRLFRFQTRDKIVRIVGVVRDSKLWSLTDDARPFLYVPYNQRYFSDLTLHVRTRGDPALLVGPIRETIRELDKDIPVYDVATLETRLGVFLADQRTRAAFVGVFALLAMVLAAVGIYGVTSYSVSQRLHEIGVRMVLGAQRQDILRLILSQGLLLALLGVSIGLAGSIALTRFLSSLLFGVSATDLLTFASVSFLLTAVVLVASYLPARRATKVDPMVALRYE